MVGSEAQLEIDSGPAQRPFAKHRTRVHAPGAKNLCPGASPIVL